jgi:hypothetical protein
MEQQFAVGSLNHLRNDTCNQATADFESIIFLDFVNQGHSKGHQNVTMTSKQKCNNLLTNIVIDDKDVNEVIEAIVDSAIANTDKILATSVAKKPRKMSKLIPIPDFFFHLDKIVAATHILCLDKGKTEIATHLLAVPISEYDSTNLSHIIPLEKIGVNRLRNICTFFNRKGSGNLSECLDILSAIKKEPMVIASILKIDLTERDIDRINRSKIAFRMTTLIFGCTDRSNDFGQLNKDRDRSVLELKKIEQFYIGLCNDVKNEGLKCHSLLLPYDNELLRDVYKGHLNPKDHLVLGDQHPKHPVTPITPKNAPAFLMQLVRMRNIMVKHLTKSGTHTTDAYDFTGLALKQSKKPRFVTKEALYYFYMQGDLNHTTMESFTPSLPKGVTGANYANIEMQGLTMKKQQQIAAAKNAEVQDLFKSELEERKVQRELAHARTAAKEVEKMQKQKAKDAEKEQKHKQREQEMQFAAVQHADLKRDTYIARLEASIEKLAKQQFRYVRMIEHSSKDATIEYLTEELKMVKEKKLGYEKTLQQLEQEKLASLSLKPFQLATRTPFKTVNANAPHYTLLLNRKEVDTPMFSRGLEALVYQEPETAVYQESDASSVYQKSDDFVYQEPEVLVNQEQEMLGLLEIVAGNGSFAKSDNDPPSDRDSCHYLPCHKKARVGGTPESIAGSTPESIAGSTPESIAGSTPESIDDASTSSESPYPMSLKKARIPGVPFGYEDAVDENESQPLIFLGRKGVPL